ncbi:hypothetical protein BDW62DRAFT_202200 [Aspergillus aurantiobrunneus]
MDNTASRRAIVWTRVTDIPGCPQDRHAALGESFCRRVLGRELMSTVPYFRHDRAPDCYDHVHIPWYFDSEEPRNAFFVIDLAVRGRIAREDNGRIPYTIYGATLEDGELTFAERPELAEHVLPEALWLVWGGKEEQQAFAEMRERDAARETARET